MKSLLVLGAGESGRGVALLAKSKGFKVFVSDAGAISDEGADELATAGIPFEVGGHGPFVLDKVDLVVKSPGIPWNIPLIAFAKTRNIPVIGEMEFCAPYRRGKLIGITGSNGKTTTTLLTGHLLKEAGVNSVIGGNVGTSYARLLLQEEAYDWYVLELSSYQLEDIQDFSVDIGMLLNLSPDHLDRYSDGMAGYAAAKYRLKSTLKPKAVWLQGTDSESCKYEIPVPAGVEEHRIPQATAGSAIAGGHGFDLSETVLSGPHNAANASFALSAALEVGISPEVLAKALKTFKNAPHRLELIGYVDGVKFVNDSKATNLDAVDKALASFDEPIIWIVGGTDKGNDYTTLSYLVDANVKAVVAMGVDNRKLVDAYQHFKNLFFNTHSLKDALISALSIANSGDVILLSPACASFDLFRNYIDRGDQFREAVMALPGFRETLQTHP